MSLLRYSTKILRFVRVTQSLTYRTIASSKQGECGQKPPPSLCGDLAKKPCFNQKKEKKSEAEIFKSMWANPECCKPICEYDRYDDLYYRESDKKKRHYGVTWQDCPEYVTKQKWVCVGPPIPPQIKRRKIQKPRTALACQKNEKCPRFKLAHCRPVRNPPRCLKTRPPKKCNKKRVQIPSYSECIHPHLKERAPVECHCAAIPSLCQVWREYQRRQKDEQMKK